MLHPDDWTKPASRSSRFKAAAVHPVDEELPFSDISESSPPRSRSAAVSGGHDPGKVATGTRNQQDVTLAGSTIVLPRATGLPPSASDRDLDAQATTEGSQLEAGTTILLMPVVTTRMPRALRRGGAHSASAIVRVRVPVYDTGHTATMASPQASTSSAIVCEESSVMDMSFNSPVHSGMRRSRSTVFARAQREIDRQPLSPEEAGDIAQCTLGGIGSESQAWSKLKHQPAYTIGAATREAEHKRMFGTSHGVGPSDHASDVSKLLPRSPVAIIGTAKRSGPVTKDAPGMNYVPATSLRTNRVALFGSSARIHPAAELESATAPGPGTYSVVDALTKTRLQHAPVVSFARSRRPEIVKPITEDGSTGPGPSSYNPKSLGVLASLKRSIAVGFPTAKRF